MSRDKIAALAARVDQLSAQVDELDSGMRLAVSIAFRRLDALESGGPLGAMVARDLAVLMATAPGIGGDR